MLDFLKDATFWTAVGSIAAAVAAIISLATVWQAGTAMKSQAFITAVQKIQDEEVRRARGVVLSHLSDGTELLESEYPDAHKACHPYDTLGILVREGFIPLKLAKYWSRSIQKTWEVSKAMIREERGRRGEDFWQSFEWLVEEVKK